MNDFSWPQTQFYIMGTNVPATKSVPRMNRMIAVFWLHVGGQCGPSLGQTDSEKQVLLTFLKGDILCFFIFI